MLRSQFSLMAGAVEVAGQVAGVPLAAGLASEIMKSCDEVAQYKRRAKSLGHKSTLLLSSLTEESEHLEGTELQQRMDEVIPILEKTLKRTRKVLSYNSITRWVRRGDIERDIERCHEELDNAISNLQIKTQTLIYRAQTDARLEERQSHSENRDLLLQLLADNEELKRVVSMHRAGDTVAEEMMKEGQEELREIREARGSGGRQGSFGLVRTNSPTPMPSSGPSSKTDSQRYLELSRGLLSLRRMAGIPPSVKILDGEVIKSEEMPRAGGTYSDIWVGQWLGEEKVALKGLRNVKADDKSAQRRLLREVQVWSKLSNPHILALYGIVTDHGRHLHIVSPWLENGSVLDYVKNFPDVDRMRLIRGAAEGLSYLHSQDIIHGNVKCTNILVSASGDAVISDFGMSKIVEDVTESPASATLTESGSARWLAPEVIEGDSPTKYADTYSFAMAILELLTRQHPFPERRRDAAVIRAIIAQQQPVRPQGPQVDKWLTDKLWYLMQSCWSTRSLRPSMDDVTAQLLQIQNEGEGHTSPVT